MILFCFYNAAYHRKISYHKNALNQKIGNKMILGKKPEYENGCNQSDAKYIKTVKPAAFVSEKNNHQVNGVHIEKVGCIQNIVPDTEIAFFQVR